MFPTAFIAMEYGAAWAIALQCGELLRVRRAFAGDGAWSWSLLRRDFENYPGFVRSALDFLLSDRAFPVFIAFTPLVSAVAALSHLWYFWAIAWIASLLISARFRGTYNGGSDSMTLVVIGAITLGRAFGDSHPIVIEGALAYVAAQTCLSFFVAGIVKLRRPKWRNGEALAGFLGSEYYGVPARVREWAARAGGTSDAAWGAQPDSAAKELRDADTGGEKTPRIGPALRIAAGITLAFECLFPLAVFDPRACAAAIALAVGFQIANAHVFGLNRFVWAWVAAYPALFWWSERLAR